MAPPPPDVRSPSDRRRFLGQRGEDAAARWYADAGYDVVARNWRCADGELDIVALAPGRDVVVICEVKTRTSTAFGIPAEAVTADKQRRLRHLAARFLTQEHRPGAPARSVRFDVASVMDDRARGLVVEIVPHAF